MHRARQGREATDFVRGLPSSHHPTQRHKTSAFQNLPSSALAGLKLTSILRFSFVEMLTKSRKITVRKVVPEPADTSS